MLDYCVLMHYSTGNHGTSSQFCWSVTLGKGVRYWYQQVKIGEAGLELKGGTSPSHLWSLAVDLCLELWIRLTCLCSWSGSWAGVGTK